MNFEEIKIWIQNISAIVELLGVVTIFMGIIIALFRFVFPLGKTKKFDFTTLRVYISKAILLGLEILIAADIMATVVTEATLRNVSVLGLIVLIRTFLSLSLQVEVEGRFPWQRKRI